MFIKEGVKNSYFYMAPLKTKKSCLKCHSKQGYKEGEVIGGISVTSLYFMKIPFLSLLWGHIIIGFVGLFGIVLAGRRLNKAMK